MSYFSVEYMMMLLPAGILLHLILPQKLRRVCLLLLSYAFFWMISGKLIVYLLAQTAAVYIFALWIGRIQDRMKEALSSCERSQRKAVRASFRSKTLFICVLGTVLQIGTLLTVKYTPFFVDNLNSLLHAAKVSAVLKAPDIAVPIGISFYTLQAVSYLIDVYNSKVAADRNLMRVALYMSFFPQLMEGPICRYTDTASRLWEAPRITWDGFIFGAQRILFGIAKKTVVADRLNLFIENVFSGYEAYDGFVIAMAAVCYTVQLYMDFSGTMDVVIGSAQIFGITMPENFRRPFFSRTISEFWTRWHITLGTWFREYLFYPVSISGPLKKLTKKARKRFGNHYGPLFSGSIALFLVWLCNGLWHGAGWHYIAFGMYHFVLILAGSILLPLSISLAAKLHISRDHAAYRFMQAIRTCILVCVGELIFRARSLGEAAAMLKRVLTGFSFTALRDGSFFTFGADRADYAIVLVFLVLVLVISALQEKGVRIRESIARRNIFFRLIIVWALIMFIIIFGAYGQGYLPVNPIYADF